MGTLQSNTFNSNKNLRSPKIKEKRRSKINQFQFRSSKKYEFNTNSNALIQNSKRSHNHSHSPVKKSLAKIVGYESHKKLAKLDIQIKSRKTVLRKRSFDSQTPRNLLNKFGVNNKANDIILPIHDTTLQNLQNLKQLNSNDKYRKSYLTKLIFSNNWDPIKKAIRYNSIIIFDWDDTILPTTFIIPKIKYVEDLILTESEKNKFRKIEECAVMTLTMAISKGRTYIVTNAGRGWVEYSARIFFPNLYHILRNLKIISARYWYGDKYPGDNKSWKINTFMDIKNTYHKGMITNIVCIGDSEHEINAAKCIGEKIEFSVVKTIKLKKEPTLNELLEQLKGIKENFEWIYSNANNLHIDFDEDTINDVRKR